MPARKEPNKVLGTIACRDCDGGICSVRQVRRGKGRYLYTTCPNCGTDQRNGSKVQSRLFHKTNWREGVEVVRPPCVQDLPKEPIGSHDSLGEPNEPSKQAALEGEVILKKEATGEPKGEPKPQPTNNRKEPMFFGLLLALSLGVGALVVR